MADNRVKIYCPACGKEMDKIYLSNLKINVDVCDKGCGGIYFDNREFEKFDEEHENADEILAIYENKTFEPKYDGDERVCPMCKSRMVKLGSGTAQNNFKIDVCYTCGAKFLDGYELQKIRSVQTTEEQNKMFFNATFKEIATSREALSYLSNDESDEVEEVKPHLEVRLTEERKQEIANILLQVAIIEPQKHSAVKKEIKIKAQKKPKKLFGFLDKFKKQDNKKGV